MAERLPLTHVALAAEPGRVVGLTPLGPVLHQEWLAHVGRWHAALAPHAGQALALFHEDPIEFAAALWGAWHAGVTVVLPADTQPVTVQRVRAHVHGWVHDPPPGGPDTPTLLLSPSRERELGPNSMGPSEARDLGADDDPPAAPEVPPRTALVQEKTQLCIFTSGSTGEPVLVPKALRQLAQEVVGLERVFGAAMGDGPVFSTVSQQHIYGLLYRILWPLAAGRPIYTLSHSKSPVWPTLPRGTLISSPAYLKRLPQPPPPADLAAVFSSGGVLPPEAAQTAQAAWGVAPFEVYGSTETGGVAWRQGPGAWQPLPEVTLRVEGGQLALRSPHLPANVSGVSDTWFVTQDRAELGPHGLTLLGRSDRIVKVAEKRVSLTALEERLRTSPWIAEARAVVLGGHRQAVAVAAVLTPLGAEARAQEGRAPMNATLRAMLEAQFEPVTLPRRWRYVDALPVDTLGKVTDAAIARLFSSTVPIPDWRVREASTAEAEVEVTADLKVFDGHFPGRPLLPGVAQIDWAVNLARQVFTLPPHIKRLDTIKFRALLIPPCVARLTLRWDAGKHALTFSWERDTTLHASGKIVFEHEVSHA